jgi:hypothetical protein
VKGNQNPSKTQLQETDPDLISEAARDAPENDETVFLGNASLKQFIKNVTDFIENSANLQIQDIESNYFDPLLQKISSKFDEGGYKGLLVNSLSYDKNLIYTLFNDSSVVKEEVEDVQIMNNYTSLIRDQKSLFDKTIESIRNTKICPDLVSFREYFRDVG